MTLENHFTFKAKLWLWQGKGAWHFITVPQKIASHIAFIHGRRRGWGTVRINAIISNTHWKTSIFPVNKDGTFLLPVKAEIRKKESLVLGEEVSVTLTINAPI